MSGRSLRRFGVGLAVAFVVSLGSSTGAQDLDGDFARTLSVSRGIDLEVSTGAGSISVRTGASGTIHVEGRIDVFRSSRYSIDDLRRRIAALEDDPPIEQLGDVVRVGDVDEDARRGLRIHYEIVVPVATAVRSRTGSGSQTIDDVDGPVEVSSGSGSLTIGRIRDRVTARAGSGSIRVDGSRGGLEVSTGSGSIRARGIDGDIESSSGSGSVDLEQVGPGNASIQTGSGPVGIRGATGRLRVQTSSGSIHAEGDLRDDWHLETSSGSIAIGLRPNTGFELDARTRSGRISSRYPITVVGSLSRRELRGEVGGGGPMLEVRTGSGTIRIE